MIIINNDDDRFQMNGIGFNITAPRFSRNKKRTHKKTKHGATLHGVVLRKVVQGRKSVKKYAIFIAIICKSVS